MKLPIYLCCDRIKYLLACSVNYLKGGCLGKPVQSLVYLGRSTVQVITRTVKLAVLSSQSDSTFVDDRVQGALLVCAFLCPVCSDG